MAAMGGEPAVSPMQMTVNVTSHFDVARGRLVDLQGATRMNMGMVGMAGVNIDTKVSLRHL
jgi:hypothetical protein